MAIAPLNLPERTAKPRENGRTCLLDPGHPLGIFTDVLGCHAPLVDAVKLGWGTALIGELAAAKVEIARRHRIRIFPGGTLFERFMLEDRLEAYLEFCRACGFETIEVSNGATGLSHREKARLVARLAPDFEVFSEVGFKDAARASRMTPHEWLSCIRMDLDAGAAGVMIETRKSGRGGVCNKSGQPRPEVLDAIVHDGIPLDRVIFEAPNRLLQTTYIRRFGANVNLANIAFADIVGVESLRLGLRADTLDR